MGSGSRTGTPNVNGQVIKTKQQETHTYSVSYAFNQLLAAPAEVAFDWCTDYQPYDISLMKEKGTRKIEKLADDAILLTETAPKNNRTIKKTKLVRLNKRSLSWTNTHVAGPNRHSQFLYRIVPEGRKRSRLYFKDYSSNILENLWVARSSRR